MEYVSLDSKNKVPVLLGETKSLFPHWEQLYYSPWAYAPFSQIPTNGLRRYIFRNVGDKWPNNVILFSDRTVFVESQRQIPS